MHLMIRSINILWFFLILTVRSYASTFSIDVYGVDEDTERKIINCCTEKIIRYEELKEKILIKRSKASHHDQLNIKLMHDKIVDEIKKISGATLVELSTILYPERTIRYTTVDIVKEDEIFRIPKAPKRSITNNLSINTKVNNLFLIWNDYNIKNSILFNTGRLKKDTKKCPASHCVWGFDDNEMNKYYTILHRQSKKYEATLQNIILHSSDELQRGDAIFILANSDNYVSTVDFLIEFIDDESDLVRNNAMRVIAAILAKHKVKAPPLNKIIQALNYPYVTDRNKAAYLLLSVARNDASTHDEIIKSSGDTLIKLLKLKQPNNHDLSYQILRTISHRNYADGDVKSWREWIKEAHKNDD